jgi:uncharacterized protein (TIGR02145 family)
MAEWNTLITACGGTALAGGVLKEAGTTRWNAPNTDAVDTYDFAAVAGGYSTASSIFGWLKEYGQFWIADLLDPYSYPANTFGRYIRMSYNTAEAVVDYTLRNYFLSVRLIRDAAFAYFPVVYGYLYNYYAATDPRNIAAAGWHIPTHLECRTLYDYITSTPGAWTWLTGGGLLKESDLTYWDLPNTGASNSYGFNGRGAGIRTDGGIYTSNKSLLRIFCSNESEGSPYVSDMGKFNSADCGIALGVTNFGCSLRPVADNTLLSDGETGTYTGNDGKVYRTICIGTQEWLADNLAETKFRNGDDIPEVTGDAAWAALATGARCSYNNLESNAHA